MKFEFYSVDKNYRKGIIFLSGRGKSLDNFNVTSTGKEINLEKKLDPKHRLVLLNLMMMMI